MNRQKYELTPLEAVMSENGITWDMVHRSLPSVVKFVFGTDGEFVSLPQRLPLWIRKLQAYAVQETLRRHCEAVGAEFRWDHAPIGNRDIEDWCDRWLNHEIILPSPPSGKPDFPPRFRIPYEFAMEYLHQWSDDE